jgi:hypothetical protein
MEINTKSALYNHWSNNPFLGSIVQNSIGQNKFQLIWRYLHLSKNESNTEPITKIQCMIDNCLYHSERLYYPEQNLAIDESMISFRGKSKFIQY